MLDWLTSLVYSGGGSLDLTGKKLGPDEPFGDGRDRERGDSVAWECNGCD